LVSGEETADYMNPINKIFYDLENKFHAKKIGVQQAVIITVL